MSRFGELITAAMGAVHALRSYQYGNSAPDLAAEIADALQEAIDGALTERGTELDRTVSELDQQLKRVDLLAQGMVPVQRIEDLLKHCREGHCTGSPEQIATMISTLEFVLGKTANAPPN
jgi:hypothetical protein